MAGAEVGESGGAIGRLLRDAREHGADPLGLDHADGPAVSEEQVIARAGLELDLAEDDAGAGGEVDGFDVLDDPAGLDESASICRRAGLWTSRALGCVNDLWDAAAWSKGVSGSLLILQKEEPRGR